MVFSDGRRKASVRSVMILLWGERGGSTIPKDALMPTGSSAGRGVRDDSRSAHSI